MDISQIKDSSKLEGLFNTTNKRKEEEMLEIRWRKFRRNIIDKRKGERE
jgi:hypothetical protein